MTARRHVSDNVECGLAGDYSQFNSKGLIAAPRNAEYATLTSQSSVQDEHASAHLVHLFLKEGRTRELPCPTGGVVRRGRCIFERVAFLHVVRVAEGLHGWERHGRRLRVRREVERLQAVRHPVYGRRRAAAALATGDCIAASGVAGV